MATDREATIRRAEKLLKQGRLDAAIEEYVQAVEEQPRDWNTVNILGDLYVRAGQVDSAVSQYARVAAHFAQEGFLQKAAALYKKIAKIKPHDEGVLLQLASLSEQQGLIADAKSCLSSVAEHRRRRGNRKGAAETVLRLEQLDPTDISVSLLAARAAAELGDKADAVRRFKAAGHELLRRNRVKEGLRALGDAAALDPADKELRRFLWERHVKAGQLDRARAFAVTADDETGQAAAASAPVGGLAGLSVPESFPVGVSDPAGDRADGGRAASSDGPVACEDPPLVRAEHALREGRYDEGRAVLDGLIGSRAASRDHLVSLGSTLVEADPDAAFVCVDVASDAAVAEDAFEAAAAALDAFVRRVPDHVAALMKLIEVSVDGGLDAMMYAAQARLADAYLATDRPADARVIAEDLVAREPWQRANIDRLRRALVALGEGDPDRSIADYLSGASPFALTELLGEAGSDSFTGSQADAAAAPQPVPPAVPSDEAEIELDFREPAEPAVLADAVGGVESVFDTWLDAQSPMPVLDRPSEGPPESAPEAVLAQPAVDRPSPVVDLAAPEAETPATADEAPADVADVPVPATRPEAVAEAEGAGEPAADIAAPVEAPPEDVLPEPELLPEPATAEPGEPLPEAASGEPVPWEPESAAAVLAEPVYAEPLEAATVPAPQAVWVLGPEAVPEPPPAVQNLSDFGLAATSQEAAGPAAEAIAEPAPSWAEHPVSAPVVPPEPTVEGPVVGAGGWADASAARVDTDLAGSADFVLRPAARADDLDRVFEMFRDEAALRGLADMGAQHLKLAAAYRDIGMTDECLGALEVAAHSPRHRFEAASQLAETLRDLGRTREAVEWFERAAEAPAPGLEAGRRLLYELGKTLTDVGESERALAVFLELQADAPDYRDVAVRVRRLSSAT